MMTRPPSTRRLLPRVHSLPVRQLHGGGAGRAPLQLDVPPRGVGLRTHPVADQRHRVRAAGGPEVAGGGVRGADGGSGGEARLGGLFAGHQRRSDQRHGTIRELHGGGRTGDRENPGLHPGREAVRVR